MAYSCLKVYYCVYILWEHYLRLLFWFLRYMALHIVKVSCNRIRQPVTVIDGHLYTTRTVTFLLDPKFGCTATQKDRGKKIVYLRRNIHTLNPDSKSLEA